MPQRTKLTGVTKSNNSYYGLPQGPSTSSKWWRNFIESDAEYKSKVREDLKKYPC